MLKINFIIKHESVGSKHCNDPKAFIGHSNDMDDICENIKEYNPNKKRKIMILFDMIVEMLSNMKLRPIVTELLYVQNLLLSLHNLILSKTIRLNSTNS